MENARAQKLELLEWLVSLQDNSVIVELMKWKKSYERVNMSVRDEMIESAQRANEDIKAGRVHTPEEVEAMLAKRFGE